MCQRELINQAKQNEQDATGFVPETQTERDAKLSVAGGRRKGRSLASKFMLAATNRLKGKKGLEKVKEKGVLYQRQPFGVSVLKREDNGPSRFGFVISTKVSSLATQRNRIKRALTEAVRQNLKQAPQGFDFVFLVRPSIAKMATEDIMREVGSFLRQTKF